MARDDETEYDTIPAVPPEALQRGDVIFHRAGDERAHVFLTVRRPKRKAPQDTPGTRGYATIDGERIPGVIDQDGDFVYQVWTDQAGASYLSTNYTSWPEDFREED